MPVEVPEKAPAEPPAPPLETVADAPVPPPPESNEYPVVDNTDVPETPPTVFDTDCEGRTAIVPVI
jgi:hypothetical protein